MPFRDRFKGEWITSYGLTEDKEDSKNDKLVMTFDDVTWAFPMAMILSFFMHEYESLERIVIYKMYDKGDFVLEAGTGSGVTGLSILRTSAKLVTYEPQIEFVHHAATVFHLNGFDDVTVVGGAIASQTGGTVLVIDRIAWDATILDVSGEGKAIDVPCVGVNEALREHGANCLHLDVEGAEINILSALDFDLVNKVTLEVHPSMIGFSAYDDIIKPLLEDAGFEMVHEAGKARNFPTHNWVEGWERKT